MTLTEVALILTAGGSLALTVWTIVKERRKPQLDEAQTRAVQVEVARSSAELNASRDLRVLDLEQWADKMKPWTREVRDKFEMVCELLKEERWAVGKSMPEIHLPPPPEPPPPRPLRS